MESLPVFAGVCLVVGCIALGRVFWGARDASVRGLRRMLGVTLYLALACFLLSMGVGAIALMNRWGAATNALEGVAVISGVLTLSLPLAIAVGAGAQALMRRRITPPTRG